MTIVMFLGQCSSTYWQLLPSMPYFCYNFSSFALSSQTRVPSFAHNMAEVEHNDQDAVEMRFSLRGEAILACPDAALLQKLVLLTVVQVRVV